MSVLEKPACPFANMDRLLRLQVQVYTPIEIPFYYHSPSFRRARTVIDIGTGNGEFLKQVAARFPDKDCLGIDSAADLIALAGRDLPPGVTAERLRFAVADAHEVEGSFDFALTRFVLQYFDPAELRSFLNRLPDLLCDGGTLLIVDAIDSDIHFDPPVPEFHAVWDAFRASRRESGFDRDIGPTFHKRVAALEAEAPLEGVRLELEQQERKLIPSTIPGHKKLFFETESELVTILNSVFRLPVDIQPALAALRRWYENPLSYTQFGLSMASYRVWRR